MSVQSVLVIAAVPLPADVGVEERRSAFWLNRLFGSGRKRKLSRDIGTCITEEQLYLESPPASPGSPRPAAGSCSRLLPDLVTSCTAGPPPPPPPPPPAAAVFVFPERRGAAADAPGELRCRLAGLDGAGVTVRAATGGGGPAAATPAAAAAAAAADAEMVEVGRCLRRCADEFESARRAARRSAPARRPLRVERLAAGALVAATAVCVCRRLCK